MYIVNCTVEYVYCKLYSGVCLLYTVQWSMYMYSMHSIQFTVK